MSAPQTPPRFSVVVPVHNVRDYLPACLDSVLQQSFTDFELIAVDDASPDDSGAILDDYAAADSRVRVIHLRENVGLGPARNVGMDDATGRFLMFVDSDDLLAPGSLDAIAARLGSVEDPEVLVFDHARTDDEGHLERDGAISPIAAAGPDLFPFAAHPELLRLLFVVWNKVYRLDWVRMHGFRFPAGYYEDAPWTYPILMSAQRISALDRVCYLYRQRSQGNILSTRSRRHFDAFDQYARVFAYLDAHPELVQWRSPMFERMTRHFVTILSSADRLPAQSRREFFARSADAYREHRPDGYAPPAGRSAIWARSLARGDYRVFRMAERTFVVSQRAGRSARQLRATARRSAGLGRKALGRLYYRAQLRRPIEHDLVAYGAYWFRGYACSPAAIHEKARELAPGLRGVWVVRRPGLASVPPGVTTVLPDSLAYYRLMARAKFFVNNVNFPHVVVKRPGTVHVQTQHGTPIKAMGLDLRRHPVAAAGMDFDRLLEHVARWDYLTSANRYSTEVWQRSYPGDYEVLEVGLPRNDRLVRARPADVQAARDSLGLAAGQQVLLYAPTFRDWRPDRFDPALDLDRLGAQLGAGWTVLVRGHYFAVGPAHDAPTDRPVAGAEVRDVSAYPTVEDLLLAADVLLTDYSSIMFDYANLDRPIVILADDWDEYVEVRGVSLDLLAEPPGVVETTQDGVVDALLCGRYTGADAAQARRRFAARFCEFDTGQAAEQVVRRVLLRT